MTKQKSEGMKWTKRLQWKGGLEGGQTGATVSNNKKKAENEGGKEGRRWDHSVMTNSLRSTHSGNVPRLNEAHSSSLAL